MHSYGVLERPSGFNSTCTKTTCSRIMSWWITRSADSFAGYGSAHSSRSNLAPTVRVEMSMYPTTPPPNAGKVARVQNQHLLPLDGATKGFQFNSFGVSWADLGPPLWAPRTPPRAPYRASPRAPPTPAPSPSPRLGLAQRGAHHLRGRRAGARARGHAQREDHLTIKADRSQSVVHSDPKKRALALAT